MKKNNMNALVKNGYDVDFVNRQIKITKEFHEKSSGFNSSEFKIMMDLRKQLPDFEIIEVKKHRQGSNNNNRVSGLNLEFMRAYIEDMYGEDSDQIRDFEKVLELSKSRKNARYAYMKKWFNAMYPNAIRLLGGIPDEERRAMKADTLHKQAKAKLAAAKELQATQAKTYESSGYDAADLRDSAA